MRKFAMTEARRFLADESGATAIEYALIASGIAGAIIAVVGTVGVNVKTMWTTVSSAFN
jgi:pilus assembly protein Flp/PilA